MLLFRLQLPYLITLQRINLVEARDVLVLSLNLIIELLYHNLLA